MKKLLLVMIGFALSACSAPPAKKYEQVQLNPPTKTPSGFVRLSPKSQYYVDTTSIWVDNDKKHLVNFDTVINLHIGHRVYEDNPNLSTRSIRQHKVLDCEQGKLTHTESHLYSEFWGEGVALAPKKQANRSVILREGSSLGTIGTILCANFAKK